MSRVALSQAYVDISPSPVFSAVGPDNQESVPLSANPVRIWVSSLALLSPMCTYLSLLPFLRKPQAYDVESWGLCVQAHASLESRLLHAALIFALQAPPPSPSLLLACSRTFTLGVQEGGV
jgi:hypothetical protein